MLRLVVQVALLATLVSVVEVNANCSNKRLRSGTCALLYEKEDCDGWEKELKEGSEKFSVLSGFRNDAESVKVRKGCTFRGYEGEEGDDREDFVVVRAPFDLDYSENFEDTKAGDKVNNDISYVSCICGNQGACPAVPKDVCAIAYDEIGCDQGDWDQVLEIFETPKRNLRLLSNERNGMESVSVRKGCTLKIFEKADLKGKNGTIAARAKDVHVDLKGNLSKGLADLNNNVVSFSCKC